MNFLHLHLEGQYFDAIKAGVKKEEYRLRSTYWFRRLEGKHFDGILLLRGYPPLSNPGTKLKRPWRGFEVKTITHPRFGPKPVEVYAIKVNE